MAIRNFTEDTLTAEVVRRMDNTQDPRLKEVMASLVRHLHAFVREVRPTQDEWMDGIQFLTETGHWCDDKRQEFILMSDTLGVSVLVDFINYGKADGATDSARRAVQEVAAHRQMRKQQAILKHVADAPLLRRQVDAEGGIEQHLAIDHDAPAVRGKQPGNRIDHAGLARPGTAEHADHRRRGTEFDL